MERTKSAPLTRSMAMGHLAHLGQDKWVIRASRSWRRKSSFDSCTKKEEASGRLFEEGAPDCLPTKFPVFLHRAGTDRHDKISRRSITYILDPVFVIRMHEPHGAWPKPGARTVD